MFQTGPLGLLGSLGTVSYIVLLVLFLFSVISWVVILSKWLAFRASEHEDKRFIDAYKRTPDPDEMRRHARHLQESPSAAVFLGILDRFQVEASTLGDPQAASGGEVQTGQGPGRPDRHYFERMVAYLVQGQISRLERYLPFLATTGNITPFIGLLGTVIGIIDAFQEIGREGSASIAVVAPGVAEALIATAAGLFTAIPAVIAYNYYLTRIRRAAFRAESFSIEFLNTLQGRLR